jgi:hypothetical protein
MDSPLVDSDRRSRRHQLRFRVGASRGHYARAAPVATAIDTGTVFITNQRVIFQGTKQTRECLFAKLIGYQNLPDGSTVLSVSNRQKPPVIHYGTKIAEWFDFRLELALAHYRGTVASLLDQLHQQQEQLVQARPAPPVGAV